MNPASLEGPAELPEDARRERTEAERLIRSGKPVTTYRGVARKGNPKWFYDLVQTKKWMDAIDRWGKNDAIEHGDQVQNSAALELLELVESGNVQTIEDVPERLIVAQLVVAATDRRRPQAAAAALKELNRLREKRGGSKQPVELDEATQTKLAELEAARMAREAARAKVRSQPGSNLGQPGLGPLRKVE